jgi:hypothetical protein
MNTELLTKREAIAVTLMRDELNRPTMPGAFMIEPTDNQPAIAKSAVRQADLLFAELEATKPVADAEFDEAIKELIVYDAMPFTKTRALLERCKRDMSLRKSKGLRRES